MDSTICIDSASGYGFVRQVGFFFNARPHSFWRAFVMTHVTNPRPAHVKTKKRKTVLATQTSTHTNMHKHTQIHMNKTILATQTYTHITRTSTHKYI